MGLTITRKNPGPSDDDGDRYNEKKNSMRGNISIKSAALVCLISYLIGCFSGNSLCMWTGITGSSRGIDDKELQTLAEKKNDKKAVSVEDGESIVAELHRVVSPQKLKQLSTKYRKTYASAQPFPHIAIDDIFPVSILQRVIAEHPESSLGTDGCIPGSMCFKKSTQNKKSAVDNEEKMGTYTRILFSFLKSSIFTNFLQDISGINDLIPDPHFRGSGLHFTSTGGNLDIHADFNKYRAYNLDRRVNIFIYLNEDWPEEYGGHLELWSKDMKSCYQRIKPKLGRFVVFSSTDFSCEY